MSQLTLDPSETIHKIPTNYLELIDPDIIGSVNKKLSDLPNVAVGYKETNPGVVITWDGYTAGKDVIEDGSKKYYKVADYPTATLPQETTMEAITSTEETVTFNSQRRAYSSVDDAVYYKDFEHYSDAECIITTEGTHKYFLAPSDGVYFYKDENIYTSKFVLKEPSETIHPTPKIYQCTTEQFTIQTSAWSAINDKSPFTYKATVTAVSLNPSFAKTNLINNDAVAFANHRFAVGEISGQNITIYSVGQPSTSKNLIIDFYC